MFIAADPRSIVFFADRPENYAVRFISIDSDYPLCYNYIYQMNSGTVYILPHILKHITQGERDMKKYFCRKTATLFCFASLLMTIGMTGCSNAQNEISSDKSSQTISSSEISDQKSQPTESSSEDSRSVSADDFTYSDDGSGNIILTKYNGKSASPELPSAIDGKAVNTIGESCFAGNTSVKKLVLPEGITDIGDYAFECCANLEEVILPDSLKTIGEGAFSACTKLGAVKLPDNIEVIKKGAFLYCQSIKSLELPENARELGNFAFSNCSSLTSVTFKSDKVKTLPDRLFYSCEKLSEININHTLDSIGKRTFARCKSLTSVSLPGELQSVGDYAFEG